MIALQKIFDDSNAICFAADNAYFKILYVALSSLVRNSSTCRNYDIIILSQNISDYYKSYINMLSSSNISIRFVDETEFLTAQELNKFFVSGHVTLPTYFRFFIPELFSNYEKVVYLDCDIVFNSDISDIFSIDMGDNILGVVNDASYKLFDIHFKNFTTYIRNSLNMDESYYFNAGVILYNIPNAIDFDLQKKCFEFLSRIKTPRFHDQDILNAVTAGKNLFLPITWNLQWHLVIQYAGREQEIRHIPYYATYYETLPNAKIIHYTSDRKPWNYPSYELAELWWKDARATPFYEAFLESATLGEKLEERLALLAPWKFRFRTTTIFFTLLSYLCFGRLKQRMKKCAQREKKKLRFAQKLGKYQD